LRYTLLSNLVIPAGVKLRCSDVPTVATFTGWTAWLNTAPALLLASGVTITAGGAAAAIEGCNILPSGLSIPLSGGSAFLPQTAVSDGGFADFNVIYNTIAGFNSAIKVTGLRPTIEHDYLDGVGTTIAVLEWDVGNTDSGFIRDVKIQQIVTNGGPPGACAQLMKAGTGLRVAGSPMGAASVFIDNVVVQEFLTRNYDFENNAIIGNLWSDGVSNSGCAASYPSSQVGVYIGTGAQIYGGSLNIAQSYTGLVDTSNGGFSTINFVEIGQSLGDCLQLGAGAQSAVVHFNDLFIGNCGISGTGHAINYVNASSKLFSTTWSLVQGNANTATAPYLVTSGSTPIGRGFRGSAFASNIVTDLPTSGVNGTNPFGPNFLLSAGAGAVVEAAAIPFGTVGTVARLGTGASATIVGTEAEGVISVNAGTGSPGANGEVTISPLTVPISVGSHCLATPTANGTGAWAAEAMVEPSVISSTSIGFNLFNGPTTFTPGSTYTFAYRCAFL
jgi:hypothetical protein